MFRQIPIGGKKVVAPSARGTQPFRNKLVTTFHVILRTILLLAEGTTGQVPRVAWQHGSMVATTLP